MVITGKAGMQVMGDWAKGEFIAAGLTAGKEYGCAVVGEGGYVMGGDVFVFPKTDDPAQPAAQDKLAEVMLDARDPDRVQQEEGLGPGPPRRRRLEHGRLRPEAGAAALRDPARQVPTHRLPDLARPVRCASTT